MLYNDGYSVLYSDDKMNTWKSNVGIWYIHSLDHDVLWEKQITTTYVYTDRETHTRTSIKSVAKKFVPSIQHNISNKNTSEEISCDNW